MIFEDKINLVVENAGLLSFSQFAEVHFWK